MNPLEAARNYISRLGQGLDQPGTTGIFNHIIGRVLGAEPLPGAGRWYEPIQANAASPSPVSSPTPSTQPIPSPITKVQPVATPQMQQGPLPGYNPSRGLPNDELLQFIQNAAKTYNIDPALLAAQLFTESGVKPLGSAQDNYNRDKNGNVISRDRGIAQINNIAHPDVTDAQAYDPQFGINFMAKTLSNNIKHFQPSNVDLAIAAYNVGRGGLETNAQKAREYQSKVWQSLTPEKAYQLQMGTPAAFLK